MSKYKHDYYEMCNFADKFLMDNYGLKRSIPIRISNRLKNSLGYFTEYVDAPQGEGAVSITINTIMMNHATLEALHDTLKHELVHYALYMTGKPYLDGDDYFEKEIARLGISSTGNLYVGEEYVIQCLACEELDIVKTKAVAHNRNGKRKSKCCKSEFKFIDSIIFDGRPLEEVVMDFIKVFREKRCLI